MRDGSLSRRAENLGWRRWWCDGLGVCCALGRWGGPARWRWWPLRRLIMSLMPLMQRRFLELADAVVAALVSEAGEVGAPGAAVPWPVARAAVLLLPAPARRTTRVRRRGTGVAGVADAVGHVTTRATIRRTTAGWPGVRRADGRDGDGDGRQQPGQQPGQHRKHRAVVWNEVTVDLRLWAVLPTPIN